MKKLTDYVTLGKSGLRVSPLALGAMTFGNDWGWGSSEEESFGIMDAYIEKGGNFIDTANIYTKGHSEKIIGNYLQSRNIRRDSQVISTKFFVNLYPGDPNGGGTGRKSIMGAVENSLRRLQTDYIDLYWMHAFDQHTPIEETLSALSDLVTSGKIRYFAISDTPAWKIAQANTISHFRGWPGFIGLQLEYSLLERTVEGDLIPMAQDLGIGVVPWSPLKGGILSGKYTRENRGQEKTGRSAGAEDLLGDREYDIIDALEDIAKSKNVSPASVALAWVISRPGVSSTLIGARTIKQLAQNLASLEVELSAGEIQRLDDLSKPALNFPAAFLTGGAYNLGQSGATINGHRSVVAPLVPQSPGELY